MTSYQFEFYCGTGGVGKTTLSIARAFYLSSLKKKVLLISIDPARRAHDFFRNQISNSISPQKVSLQDEKDKEEQKNTIWFKTLSPEYLLKKMAEAQLQLLY